MKHARIVIGANFGDEGKGLMVDYLSAKGAGVVARFNGGANAGHTVVTTNKERHVFRHFGSGTFCGVPTFLSQFFVCNPILFFEELHQLHALGFHPIVYAHPDCLVTTFMDMLINQHKENKRGEKRHGSCGIGLHETMNRSKIAELKITMSDLWNGATQLESQLAQICDEYARFRTGQAFKEVEANEAFLKCCKMFADYVQPAGIGSFDDIIFEGAQGLLLDQGNKQFRPHLTHSNTGMKNVEVLCAQAGITNKEIFYVSRTYLTRHGAGPLPGEDASMSLFDDTNIAHQFQGALRFAPLNSTELIARCALDANESHKIVLTHCDQLAPNFDAHLFANGPRRECVSEKFTSAVMA